MKSKAVTKLEQSWLGHIRQNPTQSHLSALKTSRAIQNSPLEYEVPGAVNPVAIYTRTLHMPKFFSDADEKAFAHLCDQFYGIFEKTIAAYKANPEVRKLFGFDAKLEELIQIDNRYSSAIPMLRIDIFYNEDDGSFKVCEFNTDGTSAMYENQMMDEFMALNNVWNDLKPAVRHQELMDSWAESFLQDVKEAGVEDKPAIAISDYLENAYLPELYAFRDLFEAKGYVCEVVDVRDFVFDGKALRSKKTNTAFDAIYRRAVTSDVLEKYDESTDFLEAVRKQVVVLVGNFQTQVIHSKAISEALFSPVLRQYFTPQECAFLDAHLPQSMDLSDADLTRLLEHKDQWIIKPKEGYGAKGVYAGVDLSQERWKQLLEDLTGQPFIVQEYVPHYRSENIDLLSDHGFIGYANLTGLYVYNGHFAGVCSRLSDAGIVSTQYNERMVPTFFADEDRDSQ